jgi:hypothetical protein
MAQRCWDKSTRCAMYADKSFNRTANLMGPAGTFYQRFQGRDFHISLREVFRWFAERS